LEIDKMVVVADATDARLDLFTLLSEALVLTTGRFERLLSLLQAPGFLWEPVRTALGRLITRAVRVHLPAVLRRRLCSRSSCSRASVTALWAARSLVAMGPETALTSSCCTWNRSGEWCASRSWST